MTRPDASDKRNAARTRGRPSPDEAAQIDREVLHTARELFLNHGYERTSMAMVTQTAQVSKTTLYARYATKADLFRATVRLTVDRIANQHLTAERRREHELESGLKIFGHDAVRISLTELWIKYEQLVYSEGANFPELIDGIAERINVGIETVRAFIVECSERESVPVRDPVGVATTYVMALRGFYMAAALRGQSPEEDEIKAFVDRMVDLLLAGRAIW